MEVKNTQPEAFGKWLKENRSLHDAILFEFAFSNKQDEGGVPSSENVLKLGLKIPVDQSTDEYDVVWVVLRGVLSVRIMMQYSLGAQYFLNAIYLTNAEIEDGGVSIGNNANVFRLKLYGDCYSEHEQEWNERQIVDVICESFEILRDSIDFTRE